MPLPDGRTPGFVASGLYDPGELYRSQLQQLNTQIADRDRARAVADWALAFFDGSPDIEAVARGVTRKVDDALLTAGPIKPGEFLATLPFLDMFYYNDWWRMYLDEAAALNAQNSFSPKLLSYRIPRAMAIGIFAVQDMRGRCEEHAFLALYLLTIGHMIQNMPFGRLRNDIYYAGMAVEGHAFAVVVKGAEMKDGILAAPKESEPRRKWLAENLEKWGRNAWIIDGYEEVRTLAQERRVVDLIAGQRFRRSDNSTEPSEFDLTVGAMVGRINADYHLNL